MATLYENLLGGTISDNPLTSGATTINSSAFQFLPVVSGSDIMYLTLDPEGSAGAPEIVKVTAHSSSATSVTVVRGQQDTSAREHASGIVWIHGLTEADVDGFLTTVTSGDIADGAVVEAKLGSFAVTNTKLDNDSVTTAKLLDGNVTTAKLADSAVATAKIADGAVTSSKVGFTWSSWTPTFQANGYNAADPGNGSWDAKYFRIGDAGWISAQFTMGSSSVVSSRAIDIDLPSGWTAAGPAIGHVYLTRTNLSTDYYYVLTVGESLGWYQEAYKGSNTKATAWIQAASTAYQINQYGYGFAQGDGYTVSYSIGPIPLV